MRRLIVRGATVVAAAGAAVALGAPAALASGTHHELHQVVDVRGDGSVVHLDHTSVQAGSITFRVHTTNATTPDGGGGSQITMFEPVAGKTVQDVFADLRQEFEGDAAAGTKALEHDAAFYGLADVVVGSPATVTEKLSPGTYYLVDLGTPPSGGPPQFTTLTVGSHRHGIEQDSDLRSQVSVKAVEPDRFVAPRKWPHKGTFTFSNKSGTLHFVDLQPVQPGTTDKQVQDYFDAQLKLPQDQQQAPSFALAGRPSVGAEVLSPGRSLKLTYDLPKGTYLLVCFVSDDETGMPHAVMGMHEVVTLR
jgi:hypothetical protein